MVWISGQVSSVRPLSAIQVLAHKLMGHTSQLHISKLHTSLSLSCPGRGINRPQTLVRFQVFKLGLRNFESASQREGQPNPFNVLAGKQADLLLE